MQRKVKFLNRLIMGNVVFALVLSLLAASCEPIWADEFIPPPEIPAIEYRVGWVPDEIPGNVTVIYVNGLQVAYTVMASTLVKFKKAFVRRGGVWYFQAECSTSQKMVRPEPIAWRWGNIMDWQPYVVKTWGD